MMVMAPGEGYGDIQEGLRGKRVFVWTCNTCARLCGVGGREKAEEAVRLLESGGVEVAGSAAVPAACFMSNARDRLGGSEGFDVVLALCCDIGAGCAREASGKPVVNPVETLGVGFLGEDGVPRLLRRSVRRMYKIGSYSTARRYT
ncbi:MAG: hypothetical protein J5674_05350 [Candidatus Methanomethylophilaceae archaeon]|nr:hypothetical protein [Candidatus Methanomethylophilaceae archaeon]